MIPLFLVSLILATFAVRLFFYRAKDELSLFSEIGILAIGGLGSTLVATLPTILFDHWTLNLHSVGLIFIALSFLLTQYKKAPLYAEAAKKIEFVTADVMAYLLILAIGVFLQRDQIYYLVATHDTASYLNMARHLFKTGTFFHVDEITKLAFGEPKLQAIARLTANAEPWMRLTGFGYNLENLSEGLCSYHGIFGPSVMYAIGMHVFGLFHFLKLNWLYFAACLSLLFAIGNLLLARRWVWFAGLLFAVNPAISWVFREGLSEPLFLVFALGTFLAAIQISRGYQARSFLFFFGACIATSVLVRLNGLFLLAFGLPSLWIWRPQLIRSDRAKLFAFAVPLAVISAAGVILTRTMYFTSVIEEHLRVSKQILLQKKSLSVFIPMLVIGALFLLARKLGFFAKSAKRAAPTRWNVGLGFVVLFCAAFGALYVRVFTRLSDQFVSFPFVLYPLDCLLFYAGPLVVIIGGIGIYRFVLERPFRDQPFLQLYIPFWLVYFNLVTFSANTLQPYHMRYLLEIFPFFMWGAALVFQRATESRSRFPWPRVFAATSLVWSLGITLLMNRPNQPMAEGQLAFYEKIDQELTRQEALWSRKGKKAILLAVAPSWLELAQILPLSSAYEHPLVLVSHGFSYAEKAGLAELGKKGYVPILISNTPIDLSGSIGGSRWVQWRQEGLCYSYPKIHYPTPPLEKQKSCFTWNFYQPNESGDGTFSLTPNNDQMKSDSTWVGLEIPPRTKSDIRKYFSFGPQEYFTMPKLFVNGIERPENLEILDSQTRAKRQLITLAVRIPSHLIPPDKFTQLDLFSTTHVTTEGHDRISLLSGPPAIPLKRLE